jgi:hypothetical protein
VKIFGKFESFSLNIVIFQEYSPLKWSDLEFLAAKSNMADPEIILLKFLIPIVESENNSPKY